MSDPQDRELDRRVAKLPRSIDPERDLWTDIASRIAAPRASTSLTARRRRLLVAGASALAAAAAVTFLVGRRSPRPAWPWPSPVPSAMAVASAPVPAAAPAPADALENAKERVTYRAAVQALEASLAENRRYLSSQAADRLEKSLGVLDQAIQATEQALARDPDSTELRSQLWDEYQQKIDALTAVVDLVTRTS
jgi:tetratricopeptide (TPR) repeat protein